MRFGAGGLEAAKALEPQSVDGRSRLHQAGGLRRARIVFAWQMVTRGPLVSIFFSLASDSKNDLPHGRDLDAQLAWVCQGSSGRKRVTF